MVSEGIEDEGKISPTYSIFLNQPPVDQPVFEIFFWKHGSVSFVSLH